MDPCGTYGACVVENILAARWKAWLGQGKHGSNRDWDSHTIWSICRFVHSMCRMHWIIPPPRKRRHGLMPCAVVQWSQVRELLPFLNRLAYHFVTSMPDQAGGQLTYPFLSNSDISATLGYVCIQLVEVAQS